VPESYLPRSRLNSLMMHFDHTNLDPTTWMNNTYVTRDSSKISHLRRNWIEAVLENPAAYFTHRWLAFRSFLTVIASTNLPVSEPEPDFLSEKKPPLMSETKLGRIHTKYVEWASQYLFFGFQAVTYLLGSAALLLISIWKKRMILAALSCSAFLYIAPYFFVAPAPNYRYVYWAVFAVLLSVFVWWIEKLRVQPIRFS
jgi:hypothetical protein